MAVFKKFRKAKSKDSHSTEPQNVKQLDQRLELGTYRDFFTLKNYWKAVDRKKINAAEYFFLAYIKQNADKMGKYSKLKNVVVDTVDAQISDAGFEMISAAYLKVFDDVITAVEESPDDVTEACQRLNSVGKMHQTKVPDMNEIEFQLLEEPFLHMISEVLQDRYNDKAENLFRKFYQFCLKYILEGFNS